MNDQMAKEYKNHTKKANDFYSDLNNMEQIRVDKKVIGGMNFCDAIQCVLWERELNKPGGKYERR